MATHDPLYRICFVCSGNICRSPMGEVVLRSMLRDADLDETVVVDSAGTGDWHIGHPADPRTLQVLREAGYDGSTHRARQIDAADLDERDLILAADDGHLRQLAELGRGSARIRLVRSYDPDAVAAGDLGLDDPYFGDLSGFTRCLAEVEAACRGVVSEVAARRA